MARRRLNAPCFEGAATALSSRRYYTASRQKKKQKFLLQIKIKMSIMMNSEQ